MIPQVVPLDIGGYLRKVHAEVARRAGKYTDSMAKIFVRPVHVSARDKALTFIGSVERTGDRLIVKSTSGAILGEFDPRAQWWTEEDIPEEILRLSPDELKLLGRVLERMKSPEALTQEQKDMIETALGLDKRKGGLKK